ncbi:MAG TPA: hypothetical protein VMM13_08030 [Euzebya sp.]|nr:hypothetical protein [Euzebya sp.]
MEPQHDDGVTLSAFDQRTASAVVSVLRRAGVAAWLAAGHDEDVEVLVPDGQREVAMRELGTRMEEVRAEVQSAPPSDDRPAEPTGAVARTGAPVPDPDDVHAGPPLVMERFRSMRILAAVVMAPLLVVTLAPTLRGSTARVVLVVLATVAAGVVLAFRRRR